MTRFAKSIDVDVPVRTAYNQWTQFQQSPQFMEGVDRVVQLDDKTLQWTATVGADEGWTAEITDQTPDRRVAWKSVDGADNAGAVLFEQVGSGTTQVTLKLDAEPDGPVETVGTSLGFLERRVTRGSRALQGIYRVARHAHRVLAGRDHGDEVTLG